MASNIIEVSNIQEVEKPNSSDEEALVQEKEDSTSQKQSANEAELEAASTEPDVSNSQETQEEPSSSNEKAVVQDEKKEEKPSFSRKRSGNEAGLEPETSAAKQQAVGHGDVVASHYNAIPNKGIKERNESCILIMRNFNNWVKSILINKYLRELQNKSRGDLLRVLDMCCGKGGDLRKWDKGPVKHVIFADIAEVSVQQCKKRYDEMKYKKFSAEFITCDCTKERLREQFFDKSKKVDLVSCQFAFHYSFESQAQAETMIHNASECLNDGGYFIGTLPDARELVNRLRTSPDGKRFGNDIYSVEFEDPKNLPLFGAKYNFHLEGVVDCPEFLVYPPLFKKLAAKYGLELVLFERFSEFFENMKDEGMHLLQQMKALQAYPSRDRSNEDPEEYKHAEEYLKTRRSSCIGTMSKSEWEATSIYSVFAFKKKKTTWNAEGKPVYK